MPRPSWGKILQMLAKASAEIRDGSGQKMDISIYGEGGLLAHKIIQKATLPDTLGVTPGGSDRELLLLKKLLEKGKGVEYVLPGKTVVSLLSIYRQEALVYVLPGSAGYRYVYHDNSWHVPVLQGEFEGYTEVATGTGLYWSIAWRLTLEDIPVVSYRYASYTSRMGLSQIWGYIPLDEISQISAGGVALANKCFVVDFTQGGKPTDKEPGRYISGVAFLANLGFYKV